jgi:hypothetical protein
MSGPWIPFLIAVGAVSVIWYRLQSRRPGRRWSSDTGGRDVSYSADSGSSSWTFSDWFGSSSASPDSSGSSGDTSGSWDSGGSGSGGDGGGDSGGGGSSD